VAQLVISLASLPALFERLDRPGVAQTMLGAMAREQGSSHHVPGLGELGQRLNEQLTQEAAERFTAAGAAMSVRDAASYALNQIDIADRALAAAGQHGGRAAGLTARETQVLRQIADGANTREISERLFISAKTADNHIQHIYLKLGVTNRAAATRWAFDNDVVAAGEDPK
jgi:DNA-binding CsgD family transcriptional regulator